MSASEVSFSRWGAIQIYVPLPLPQKEGDIISKSETVAFGVCTIKLPIIQHMSRHSNLHSCIHIHQLALDSRDRTNLDNVMRHRSTCRSWRTKSTVDLIR